MPMKKCSKPECNKLSGPRTLYCACGTPFTSTLRAFGHIKGGKASAKATSSPKQNVVVNNNITVNQNGSKIDLSKITARTIPSNLPINLDKSYFSHLLERDAQIDILFGGVQTAIESDFKIRSHAILAGSPASGKSSMLDAFVNMVGEELCFRINFTTSTQAGSLKELIDQPDGIRFLLLEEICKTNPENLRWLISVMDETAQLSVCNAKDGYIRKPFPVFVIATANDLDKVKGYLNGAIASRFGDHIYCPRVSDDAIYNSVKRYVDMVSGDHRWIRPAMEYCRNVEKTDDLRRIKVVALNGRDRLLDGSYFDILRAASNN